MLFLGLEKKMNDMLQLHLLIFSITKNQTKKMSTIRVGFCVCILVDLYKYIVRVTNKFWFMSIYIPYSIQYNSPLSVVTTNFIFRIVYNTMSTFCFCIFIFHIVYNFGFCLFIFCIVFLPRMFTVNELCNYGSLKK